MTSTIPHTTPAQRPAPAAAATDVAEFLTDLDGGQFERALSVALSRVAAHVVDHAKAGEVQIKLKFLPIKGTLQVGVNTKLQFVHPTMQGKAMELAESDSVMHVGRGGSVSLAQQALVGKHGEIAGS